MGDIFHVERLPSLYARRNITGRREHVKTLMEALLHDIVSCIPIMEVDLDEDRVKVQIRFNASSVEAVERVISLVGERFRNQP